MERIRGIRYRRIQRTLKTTFTTALGSKDVIDSFIVRVSLESGACGEGEIPTSFAFREETLPEIRRVLREIIPGCRGMDIEFYPEAVRRFRSEYPRFTMTISGIEVALFRAWLKSKNLGELAFWSEFRGGKPVQDPCECRTDITVPFTDDSMNLFKWLKRVVLLNFREYKIKIGGDPVKDLKFLGLIEGFLRDHCPEFKLRLDGNQGYRKDSFLRFFEKCAKRGYPLELVEQPLPRGDYAGLRDLTRELPVPIILDESVHCLEDLNRALDMNACDGVNIKLAKSGISETGRILKGAAQNNLKLMIGCMTETMTGLSAAIRLAMGSGVFNYLDLDSIFFLSSYSNSGKQFNDIEINGSRYRIRSITNINPNAKARMSN